MTNKKPLPEKWRSEQRAVKATQMAFDVGDEVQYQLRLEALKLGITPSERIRQILGLATSGRTKRPRLSISLSEADFSSLAESYDISDANRIEIKKYAAQMLINHIQQTKASD